MSDDVLFLVAVWYLLSRGATVKTVAASEWGDGWFWPVADLPASPARVSQEFRPPSHMGVDIMYRGDNGRWFAPEGTPVLAARAGTVWSVTPNARGIAVVLDHGKPWATFYQHLASADVKKGDVVAAGQRIGVMGIDPTDPQRVRHLHFAAWYKGAGDAASVDPTTVMTSWRRSVG